jgi:RNA polymerase sporulation-specific sigma factor
MQDELTKEQSDLASNNHNLIYKFAQDNGLYIDDYYDILAIGLCKAAMVFDESKAKFSVIAYRCMRNELFMYWRKLNRKSSIPYDIIDSYDAPSKNEYGSEYEKLSESFQTNDFTDDVIFDIMLSELDKVLNKKQSLILKYIAEGKNKSEISQIMGCKRQTLCYHIKQLRKKAEALN